MVQVAKVDVNGLGRVMGEEGTLGTFHWSQNVVSITVVGVATGTAFEGCTFVLDAFGATATVLRGAIVRFFTSALGVGLTGTGGGGLTDTFRVAMPEAGTGAS
jgi:hypothetical protein